MSDFPERLVTLRRAHGLTQKELADRIAGSAAAVKKWEQGGTRPVPQTVAALAVALGVAPATLMGEDDRPPETIADARLRRGLRADDVAQEMGVSGRHWRRVETGEVLPPDPTALASLLRVTQPDLAELWWRSRLRHEHGDQPVVPG
jgi:transcriptional regulator with XRE-family HTH domain